MTKLDVRSRRGKNKGRKITGIVVSPDNQRVLISSNDSRIRCYYLSNYSMSCKYKGLTNKNSQIRGTFSHDGAFVISGSEDRNVYIWSSSNENAPSPNVAALFSNFKKDHNNFFDCFSDHEGTVTNALFFPFAQDLHQNHYFIATGDFKGNLQIFRGESEGS